MGLYWSQLPQGFAERQGEEVRTNVFVRELGLHPRRNRFDALRLEVVVDGLEFFYGAQLAVDATLISALRAEGTVSRKGATIGGEALRRARARKERIYPEVAGEGGRAKLVVLAAEVVDVGQTKLPSSCVLWHGPKRRVFRSPPKPKWHTHGIGDGGNFWHA